MMRHMAAQNDSHTPSATSRSGDSSESSALSEHEQKLARRAQWYAKYTRISTFPLFVLSLLFVYAFVIKLTPNHSAEDDSLANQLFGITWAAFAIDYAIGITLSPDRRDFIRTHVLEALAVIFPPLRILRLGQTFEVINNEARRRGDAARIYLLYTTVLLLIFGAIGVVYFEQSAPNANIKSFSNAIWWTGETVSTVGYGDYYPVTTGGRLIAWMLFINGVALISVVTGSLAQIFTEGDGMTKGKAPASNSGAATSKGSGTKSSAGSSPEAAAAAITADGSITGGGLLPGAASERAQEVDGGSEHGLHKEADEVVSVSRRDLERLLAALESKSTHANSKQENSTQDDPPDADPPEAAPPKADPPKADPPKDGSTKDGPPQGGPLASSGD